MNIRVFEQLGRIAVAIERSKCASPYDPQCARIVMLPARRPTKFQGIKPKRSPRFTALRPNWKTHDIKFELTDSLQ